MVYAGREAPAVLMAKQCRTANAVQHVTSLTWAEPAEHSAAKHNMLHWSTDTSTDDVLLKFRNYLCLVEPSSLGVISPHYDLDRNTTVYPDHELEAINRLYSTSYRHHCFSSTVLLSIYSTRLIDSAICTCRTINQTDNAFYCRC